MIVHTSPAIRVFAANERAELMVTDTHAAIRQGPWTWTTKLIEGKYPNWKQVVPKEDSMPTRVEFSDGDATRLQKVLPRLKQDDDAAVVLKISGGLAQLRAGSPAINIGLAESKCTGPAVTTTFNGGYLLQALSRGFRTLLARDECSPVLMRDGSRIHLWMPIRRGAEPVPPPAREPAAEPQPEPAVASAAAETSASAQEPPVRATATDVLQRGRELVRDLQGVLVEAVAAVRELEREKRGVERDLELLRRNLRALKSVEV